MARHTVTANGNAQLDTAQKKFGTASLLLDGTGDYLSIPDSADWFFGGGDFTIECWVRFSSFPSGVNVASIWSQADSTESYASNTLAHAFQFADSGTDVAYDLYSGGGAGYALLKTNLSLSTGTWYHFACVKNAGTMKIYIGGSDISAGVNGDIDRSVYDYDNPFLIGAALVSSSVSRFLDGWIDEFRISNIARYTGGFTPSASAFTPDGNTLLLLHFDGADTSTTITDSAEPAFAGGVIIV